MVNERKKQEAQTFLGKKGIEYALNYASIEEKAYFNGILYENNILSLRLLSNFRNILPSLFCRSMEF